MRVSQRFDRCLVAVGLATSALLLACPTTVTKVVYLDAGQVSGAFGASISSRAGSRQAPQGAGAVTVVLSGNGLSNVSVVTSDLSAAVGSQDSDTAVSVVVTVPHGARIGAHDLTVTSPQGVFTLVGALIITPITADVTGSDSNAGTTDSPFRSVTHALAQSGTGDTVHLNAGVFTNEPWTLENDGVFPPASTPNVPSNVIIEGDDAGSTIISMGATDGGRFVAFSLSGDDILRNLSINGFTRDAVLWSNNLTLDGVELSGALDGLMGFGDGGIWLLGGTRSHANLYSGVAAFDHVTFHGVGTQIDHNAWTGMYLGGNASADLVNTSFISNGGLAYDGRNGGVAVFSSGIVSLNRCTFDKNAGIGIYAASGLVSIEQCSITESMDHLRDGGLPNSGVAIYADGTSSVAISGSTIDGTTNNGVNVTGAAQLTLRNSGIGNTFYSTIATYASSQLSVSDSWIYDAGTAGVGHGLYLSGQEGALNNVTFSNINGTGVLLQSNAQLGAHKLRVLGTTYDGLTVAGQQASAQVDDAWFDNNASAMSVFAGSLRASSIVATDAGFYGLYIEGALSSAWITSGSNDGGLLGGLIGTGTAFMTVRESNPGAPGGFCLFDNRPANSVNVVRVDGRLLCAEDGPGTYIWLPGPQNAVGPEEFFLADAGYLKIVNPNRIEFH